MQGSVTMIRAAPSVQGPNCDAALVEVDFEYAVGLITTSRTRLVIALMRGRTRQRRNSAAELLHQLLLFEFKIPHIRPPVNMALRIFDVMAIFAVQ